MKTPTEETNELSQRDGGVKISRNSNGTYSYTIYIHAATTNEQMNSAIKLAIEKAKLMEQEIQKELESKDLFDQVKINE